MSRVAVVGAGLAGSECALQLAHRGVDVVLYEQRPQTMTAAHKTEYAAELVCSNSFKSQRIDSCAGLLKNELKHMGSYVLDIAEKTHVDAGGALAVDREKFSQKVTCALVEHPNITFVHKHVEDIPSDMPCVIATGPLCSDDLFQKIATRVGSERMSFYDAAAPIVDAQTIDTTIAFKQSRYEDAHVGDYLNCPFTKDEYDTFYTELIGADRTILHEFEQKDLFCACQPAEEVARTGHDALRFGAMKPVGLVDPRTNKRPYACVQLRAENEHATAYNLVGFQTNLTWPEQKRVFRMIPGLEQAEFFRYGVMHRNSFIDSPHTLDATFKIPHTQIRFAGQITGTEGYTEAIASGLLAALNTYADLSNQASVILPSTSAFGALCAYATDSNTKDYQPMHVNFGLVPPLEERKKSKKERYRAYSERAQNDLKAYLDTRRDLFTNKVKDE